MGDVFLGRRRPAAIRGDKRAGNVHNPCRAGTNIALKDFRNMTGMKKTPVVALRVLPLLKGAALPLLLTVLTGCATSGKKVRTAADYTYYPPPPVAPRVQFLRHIRSSEDFAPPRNKFLDFVVGENKDVYTTVAKAYGIEVLDGKLFVADTMGACIAVFDISDKTLTRFGRRGRGTLRKPINIRKGPNGYLYVADTLRKQVVVFDPDGNYMSEYGDGESFTPADVAVTATELYVLDNAAHDIKVYDLKTYKLKRTIGQRGPNPGQFNFPTNLVMDDEGNLYVCDSMNLRVQKLGPAGETLLTFGKAGQIPGHFARPRGVAVDRDGIIYVADAMQNVVQMFDREGRVLMHIGQAGTGEGGLLLPAQVVVDYESVELFRKDIAPDFDAKYLIFVTNQFEANKISIFAFGESKRPVAGAE
jgi:DNA-binding beta-propeller fold protein YncE